MKKIYTGTLVLVCMFIAQRSFAAIDVYMRVYDNNNTLIAGESVNQYFPNWIELASVAESSTATLTTGGTGAGAGRATLNPLKFQMPISSASLPLLTMMYGGSRARSVDIWFVKTGPQACACAFYKIHMENVFITSVETASSDEQVDQQLSFAPQQIAWAYYKQSNTGSYPSQPTNRFGWNISTNVPFNYAF